MASQDLEFLISQSLSGDLSPEESAQLAAELAATEDGQQLLAEHLSLDSALHRYAPPPPEVNWAGLTTRISQAIDAQDAERETAQRSRFRIGRWLPLTAIAAGVMVMIGVGSQLLRQRPSGAGPVEIAKRDAMPAPAMTPMVIVAVDASLAPAINAQPVSVAVGPAGDFAKEPGFSRYANGVVSRPSRVTIASSLPAPRGSANSPF